MSRKSSKYNAFEKWWGGKGFGWYAENKAVADLCREAYNAGMRKGRRERK